MKKNGFTLIELIGVIVILSLLTILVVPTINSVLKNSKEKAYNTQVDEIIKAGKEYFIKHPECLPDTDNKIDNLATSACHFKDDYSYITVEELIESGYITNNQDKIKANKVVDPRDSDKCLNGNVRVAFDPEYKQYEYDYDDGVTSCK